jgi:hypothetical protein
MRGSRRAKVSQIAESSVEPLSEMISSKSANVCARIVPMLRRR